MPNLNRLQLTTWVLTAEKNRDIPSPTPLETSVCGPGYEITPRIPVDVHIPHLLSTQLSMMVVPLGILHRLP